MAPSVLRDPTTTVRLNGVAAVAPSRASVNPFLAEGHGPAAAILAPVRVKERDGDREETGESRVLFRVVYVFDTLCGEARRPRSATGIGSMVCRH
jgi:hypothetical protein